MSVTVCRKASKQTSGSGEGSEARLLSALSGPSSLPAVAEVRSSALHTTDARTAHEVVFYRLREKFVDHERSIPEEVRSVLYYTLAIGHHAGVIDCLKPRLATSREVFAAVLDLMEPGEGRDKLAGIEEFGEIEVKKEHVRVLRQAVIGALERIGSALDLREEETVEPGAPETVVAIDAPVWLEEFLLLLAEIQCEPCVYAMGRRVTC